MRYAIERFRPVVTAQEVLQLGKPVCSLPNCEPGLAISGEEILSPGQSDIRIFIRARPQRGCHIRGSAVASNLRLLSIVIRKCI